YIAAWCIAQQTEHPEEAWAVARHFATPEAQRINSSLGLALPTLWSVARSADFVNPEVPPADDEVFLEAVPGARPMLFPTQTKITRAMRIAVDAAVRLQTESPEAALAKLQREIDGELSSELARGEFARVDWRAVVFWVLAGVVGAAAGIVVWSGWGRWRVRWRLPVWGGASGAAASGAVVGGAARKHRGRGAGVPAPEPGSESPVVVSHLSSGDLGGTVSGGSSRGAV